MSATDGLGPQWKPLPPLTEGQQNRVNLLNELRGGNVGGRFGGRFGTRRPENRIMRVAASQPYPKQMPLTNVGSLFEQLAPGQFDPAALRNARRRLN